MFDDHELRHRDRHEAHGRVNGNDRELYDSELVLTDGEDGLAVFLLHLQVEAGGMRIGALDLVPTDSGKFLTVPAGFAVLIQDSLAPRAARRVVRH